MPVLARSVVRVVTVLVMLCVGAAGSPAALVAERAPSANPLAARPFYVDPESAARDAAATPAARSVPSQAAQAATMLGDIPQARWFTEATPTADVAAAVETFVGGAASSGAMPTVVVYAVPHRDCGGFSAGGLPDASAYAAWIRQVRAGIGGRPAVVIVEPDALVSIGCLDSTERSARYEMLRDAVIQLSADPATVVYVDGGHSRWLTAAELAERLEAVGVSSARGFALNVSNFFTTSEEDAYGEAVSDLLGGAHYVVDTSRNGAGPAPDAPLNWCNPPDRALGSVPTTATGVAHADAYLWIKNPGQSDGDCGRGDPTSGVWFPEYAVGLVQRSG